MATSAYPIAQAPIAARLPSGASPAPPYEGFVTFDVLDTLIAQYCNSPILYALVQYVGAWLDGRVYDDFFYFNVWNLDTAVEYGLDILGRIVGASRYLTVPEANVYIGFAGQDTAQNWGHGIWNRGANGTLNVRLADDVYRRVILAKARANVSGLTIPETNAILMLLFPDYGNSYVVENEDGSISYSFGATLSAVDYAIISQEGLLPRPTGRAVTIVQR